MQARLSRHRGAGSVRDRSLGAAAPDRLSVGRAQRLRASKSRAGDRPRAVASRQQGARHGTAGPRSVRRLPASEGDPGRAGRGSGISSAVSTGDIHCRHAAPAPARPELGAGRQAA